MKTKLEEIEERALASTRGNEAACMLAAEVLRHATITLYATPAVLSDARMKGFYMGFMHAQYAIDPVPPDLSAEDDAGLREGFEQGKAHAAIMAEGYLAERAQRLEEQP